MLDLGVQMYIAWQWFQSNTGSLLVPGKPPRNITLQSSSLATITVNWDLPQSNHCKVFQSTGFRVFYGLNDTALTHSIDINMSTNNVVIRNLKDFEYYFIWLQRITTRGLGPRSEVEKLRTLEKGKLCDMIY